VLPHRSSGRLLLIVYVVVGVVVLASTLAGSALAEVAGWFAIPLLAEVLIVTSDPPRPRAVVLLAGGLVAFAVADVGASLIPGEAALPVAVAARGAGLALMLGAVAPLHRDSIIHTRRSWLGGYALFYLVILFAVRQDSGAMLVPLLAYGALLLVVAVLATGLGFTAGFGGLLLALAEALAVMYAYTPGWDRPGVPFWVELARLAGLGLILLGALGRWQAGDYGTLERWSLRGRTTAS